MAFSPKPRLVQFPAELLHLIVHFLCEENSKPPNDHILSLSRVCRLMRRFCFAPLFSRLRIKHTDRLRLLRAKCAEDIEFACLITELDLSWVHSPDEWSRTEGSRYLYGPDILPTLISTLLSLKRLHLPAYQLDPNLLATLNTHPKLTTVVVSDSALDHLKKLWSKTLLSMSKLEVDSASLTAYLEFRSKSYRESPDFHSLISRNLRLAHLIIGDESNIVFGPDIIVIPGLQAVDIDLCARPAALLSWLPAFVERHSRLKTVKIFDYGSIWQHDWGKIIWPFSLLDASERHLLTSTTKLAAFWISPLNKSAASSLDDWQVGQVELEVKEPAGIAALPLLGLLAPHLTSLILRMKLSTRFSVRCNDLISSLCALPSLQKLELPHLYRELSKEDIPCGLPSRSCASQISGCVDAHAVLRSLSACIYKRATSLAIIRVVDGDNDIQDGCRRRPWTLDATYKVGSNGEIEFEGFPRFSMPQIFRPPDDVAQSLSLTEENTEYYVVPCVGVDTEQSQKKKRKSRS
ncbi:hypothetical protein R3P38DRAFT_3507205 [Favolaschia claudopus]|uniref:F-box domain-containing protein n=1 Tax=Favolaschia claudopus TaxID=2862362 RepID=A0AAW0BXI1_9AGAR